MTNKKYKINNMEPKFSKENTSKNLNLPCRKYTDEENSIGRPADFEKAIEETGYGKFNIMLLIISIPSMWASIFETTTMSYVFPAAQCDLDLTLGNKGLLNAITYTGMISSAILWGFMADTFGRRKLLLVGFLLDGMFVFMSALSQSFTTLLITKFMGGLIINGPFAAMTSYISEFHTAKYRARMQFCMGTIFSGANFILPLLAWGVLQQEWDMTFFNGLIELHSWNFYLLICSVPAFLSAILFIFLPESPKFLMTAGKNEEALNVFKIVYHLNTGKPKDTFPIKELLDEVNHQDRRENEPQTINTRAEDFKKGLLQTKQLCFPPHISKILLCCLMQFLVVLSLNSLRLWMPQIFQAINDYEYFNNGTSDSLCIMLETIKPAESNDSSPECFVNMDNAAVYQNSMIIGATQMIGYIITVFIVNPLGKKRLLFGSCVIAGLGSLAIYFSNSMISTLALSALFISFSGISVNIMLSVVIEIFPTSLRTMTVSLLMMIGRIGAMIGNMVFPYLLKAGCAPPFATIAVSISSCAVLTYFLPNTDLKALE